MSILIFANVVAGIPSGLNTVLQEGGRLKFSIVILVSLALLVLIVFVDQGQRRIPVTFAKRVVGRKMYGGSNTYIPLKVNQAGRDPDHLRQLGALHPGPALERHPLGRVPELGEAAT